MRTIVSTRIVLLVCLCLVSSCSNAFAIGQQKYIDTVAPVSLPGAFFLAYKGDVPTLYVDSNDWPGVIRAVNDLAEDINRVTGILPKITHDPNYNYFVKPTVVIGTIGKSKIIDEMIHDDVFDVNQIASKWESFIINSRIKFGAQSLLIIAGSDKRGTIYGIYDLSEQIGVSPWYWWADVPVEHKDSLFVKAGTYVQGPPAVKYRGIFINDEGFALTPWVKEKYGNYNSQFYTKVFELLLRLKANYLWPAMWNNAFNEDDPNNPRLADEYGIVMGTSHQEPMLRGQKEWDRKHSKVWNYYTDANTLRDFWRDGIRRNRNYESIITMGLRGANDSELVPNGTDEQCMKFLEEIVADQRKMITEEINPDINKVPQMWCLYKEVQGYYQKGLRVPDDVTLLWAEDNWGNVRRLPTEEERKRPGGAGVYYHFDYHGGPRSYEWINSIQNAKIWEQMTLAYNYGATRIWIVNVGDIKPMEYPIEFFMTFAWDPQKWPKERISEFAKLWAQREFGPKYADTIADVMAKYTKYHARRKAELLDPTTFSLTNYREADTVAADFNAVSAKAEKIYNSLPANYKDAYYQLVLYPAKALAQVTDLYIAAAKNKLYAEQGRASTNDLAAQAKALFKADADMSLYYNKTMAGGKWNHMMDAVHIGWTSWNPPGKNIMPKVAEINVPAEANLGVAVEGSRAAWPGSSEEPALPEFSFFGQRQRYIDVFNRGQTPFEFTAKADKPWIVLSAGKGKIEKEQRLLVNIDWNKAPEGKAEGIVKIAGTGKEVAVKINSFNPAEPNRNYIDGFIEADGFVSIEAEHYTKKVDIGQVRWEKIDDYGRTLSSMTVFPVTAKSVEPPVNSPFLEYRMWLFNPKSAEVELIVAPTLNFAPGRGLRIAASFDDELPKIIDILPANFDARNGNGNWEQSVRDSVRKVKFTPKLEEPAYYTLKIWMVDPGVVLQKIVVNTGGVKPSYLGPPESYNRSSVQPESN